MFHILKVFCLTAGAVLIIDFLWLGVVMSNFYKKELGTLARLEGGNLKPVIWAAAVVYILIPLGIVLFALPRVSQDNLVGSAILWGALFGFVLYGVYDMTNYSLVSGWPGRMSVVDMFWGGAICAAGTVIAAFLDKVLA